MVPNRTSGLIVALMVLFILSPVLLAQESGKIRGTVTDSETGEGLAGVNVQLLDDGDNVIGGAATNFDGEYFILNVRAGLYKVRASYVGFNTVTVTNVAVSVDRTITINIQMESTALQHQEVTITADRDEVKLDVTHSESKVSGEDISKRPVTSIGEVLETKAGIVERDGQIHMRGGRSSEVTYMVDGMPVTDPTYGAKGLEVATSSVQEVSVQTGSYNAEYGGALSGIVNIVTREGSINKFSGSASYLTDDFFVDELNKFSRNSDRLEFSLSGPEPLSSYVLPKLGLELPRSQRISYFLSVTGENTDTRYPYNYLWDLENHIPTQDEIGTPYAIDYDWFGFFPERRYNEYTATLKLKQKITPSMSYTVTGTGNWTKSRSWSWDYTFTPQNAQVVSRKAYQLSIKWVHNLSPRTFYEIRAGYFRTGLDSEAGGNTPDYFAVDSSIYNSLEDWSDINGDGVPQVRVKWWDSNSNGQWDFWEYWEPIIDYVDTVWTDASRTAISYLDTVYIDERPPMLGEEPWYEVNDNGVFEPRETNFNSYILASPMDRPEPWQDGEPFRDGMPFGIGFYGQNVYPGGVFVDDTLWIDHNGNGIKEMGEFVFGSYYYNNPSVPEEYHIALEETTWNDINGNFSVDWGEFVDVNRDGIYTYRNNICDFIDANGNGVYDVGEEGEPFLDLNGNGKYDPPNFERDEWEPYIDLNGNGKWDNTDLFLDRGYNRWAVWHRRETNILLAKADITSQVDDNNQVKTGLEFQYINMNMQEIQYPEFKYDREPDGGPYQEHGIFRSFYERSPKQFAWYIQDKMEYGGLIANIGVRLDVFLQAGEVLEDSTSLDIIEVLPDYDEIFKSQSRLSPRIGMSFPITDRAKLFFSYAHLYQLPGYDNFYQMPTQASRAGRLIGNPNLGFEKTVTYELGVGYGISDAWTLEFSGYYKDIYGLLNTVTQNLGPLSQSVYENQDYARSRGIEVSARKSYTDRWSVDMNYQYAFAFGKSSSNRSGYDALFDQSAIPLQDLPLNWDQRHMINLIADYRVQDGDNPIVFGLRLPDKWGLNALFQYGSGFPYTPTVKNPNWDAKPGEKAWERENALRMPPNYNIDLRFNKDFTIAGMDYSFLVWVQNLTNRRNIEYVYSETGEPDDWDIDDGLGNGLDYAFDPSHWSAPTNIRLGLQVSW